MCGWLPLVDLCAATRISRRGHNGERSRPDPELRSSGSPALVSMRARPASATISWPGCRGVQVDDTRRWLLGNPRAKIRLVRRLVTRIAALERPPVSSGEPCAVLVRDGLADLGEAHTVHCLEQTAQVHLAARDAAHGNDAHRPAQVRPCLVEIELRERPVLALAGEPQIAEVVVDIHHGVGLTRKPTPELVDLSPEFCDLRAFVGSASARYVAGQPDAVCEDKTDGDDHCTKVLPHLDLPPRIARRRRAALPSHRTPRTAPPRAAITTTSHAGKLHKASRANTTRASARSADVLIALVQTG